MLRPWLQVLPVFIYKWIAKMNCSVTFISASNYVQPAEDILFKIKTDERCESCKRGYDGTNGNGYQPCGCDEVKSSEETDK